MQRTSQSLLVAVLILLVLGGALVFFLGNREFESELGGGAPAPIERPASAPEAPFNAQQIIPGRQIGPVTLEMTQEQVVQAIGDPDTKLNKMWSWRKPQMSVGFGPDSKVIVILAGGAGAGAKLVPFRTPEGIAIDSTAEQVIVAWGKPDSDRTEKAPLGVSRHMHYNSRGIQMMFHDNKLIWFSVRKPAIATRPS